MKKIGILTLCFDNYGTRLQSFALCKVLNDIVGNNASIDVINMEGCWRSLNQSPFNLLFRTIKGYKFRAPLHLIELVKWILWLYRNRKVDHASEKEQRRRLFDKINSIIPYTKDFYTCNDIREGKLPDFDITIVGSDQVWNGIKVGNQDVYMLDYLKDKKGLTYAASFGMTHIPKIQLEDYKRRINNFDNLLIREEEGIELCKQLGRNDAKFVLDPTLLLSKEEYLPLLKSEININESYILVYSLNYSYKIYDEAYKLSKRTGCKMIVLKRSFCPPDISKYENAKELYAVSPEGFLSLINGAACVITNSYHALLFSINLETPFYLYLDNADEENSRMLTITRICKLNSRVYWETGKLPNDIIPVDYSLVKPIIERLRERSISLLQLSLKKYSIL